LIGPVQVAGYASTKKIVSQRCIETMLRATACNTSFVCREYASDEWRCSTRWRIASSEVVDGVCAGFLHRLLANRMAMCHHRMSKNFVAEVS